MEQRIKAIYINPFIESVAETFENMFRIGASMGTTLVCALIAALIYAHKGKSWTGGAALGFFMGPLGIFIALMTANAGPKKAYAPQPMTLPKMRAYNGPVHTQPPRRVEYRLPGRCPHCNAPVHQQELHSPYASCPYCGSQIEAASLPV